MYKLLIAEDENALCDQFRRMDWSRVSLELTVCCHNGLEAYSFLLENPVDVVITDIKMPFMDGIELIKAIRREFPYIAVVCLSAYSDFEYTRVCLQNQVFDYILKPFSEEMLLDCFTRLLARLNDEKARQEKQKLLNEKLSKSTGLFRDAFLNRWFTEPIQEEEIREYAAYSELDVSHPLAAIVCFEVDAYQDNAYSPRVQRLIYDYFNKVMTEHAVLLDGGFSWTAPDASHIIAVFAAEEGETLPTPREHLKDKVLQIKKTLFSIKAILKSTISVKIAENVPNLKAVYPVVCQLRQRALPYGDMVYFMTDMVVAEEEPAAGQTEDVPLDSLADASQKQIIQTALDYIHKNFNRSLTLKEVAGVVYLNPAYFSSLFNKTVGSRFVDYLADIRIEHAKKLLLDPRYQIQDVASAVGYEHHRYFSQVFKKKTNLTPYEFRNR